MRISELFGLRLRELRQKQQLTQQQLGDHANVNYKYVGAIERGEENPSLGVIAKLADALGVRAADLLEFEHTETDPAFLRGRIQNELEGASAAELQIALRLLASLRR